MVLPMLADYLLPRGPGKLVITNLSTTALVEDVAAQHGGRVIRVPVGRQATIDALQSYRPEQIAIAGEGTGAVMMPQIPLRLRRHRLHARRALHDARARAEALARSWPAIRDIPFSKASCRSRRSASRP